MNGPITSTNVINDPNYWQELEERRPKPRIRHGAEFNFMMNTQDSVGYLFRMQELQNQYDKTKMLQKGIKNMQPRSKSTERSITTPYSTVTPLEEYMIAPECICGSHFIKVVTGYRQPYRQPTKPQNNNKACQATPASSSSSSSSSSTTTTTKNSRRTSKASPSTTTRTCVRCPIDHENGRVNARFEYLKAHSKSGPPRISEEDMVYPQIEKINTGSVAARVQIPRTKSAPRQDRRNINYIRANAYALKETEAELKKRREMEMEAQENTVMAMKHYKAGELPKYFKRTKEAATSYERNNEPEKLEKVNMDEFIENLKEIREDLLGRLNSLPISMDSVRAQTRQKQIIKNIDDVDEAIEYYRKKKIYLSNRG